MTGITAEQFESIAFKLKKEFPLISIQRQPIKYFRHLISGNPWVAIITLHENALYLTFTDHYYENLNSTCEWIDSNFHTDRELIYYAFFPEYKEIKNEVMDKCFKWHYSSVILSRVINREDDPFPLEEYGLDMVRFLDRVSLSFLCFHIRGERLPLVKESDVSAFGPDMVDMVVSICMGVLRDKFFESQSVQNSELIDFESDISDMTMSSLRKEYGDELIEMVDFRARDIYSKLWSNFFSSDYWWMY